MDLLEEMELERLLFKYTSNYDKNYTGVISIDRKKMNKVDYLDMPVAYAMGSTKFFLMS